MKIPDASNDVRLQATLAYLSSGSGNASFSLYANPPAADFGAVGTPLATVVLASTPGTLASHKLVLNQKNAGGDLILQTGTPTFGRLLNANGDIVCEGTVAADGTGDFNTGGTGPTGVLYAGGSLVIGSLSLG